MVATTSRVNNRAGLRRRCNSYAHNLRISVTLINSIWLTHSRPVYTMDHNVGPWRCKSIDWLLNSSGATSIYTKEKMAEGPWRSRSPKYNFQGLINALTWSNMSYGERGKRGSLVEKGKVPRERNDVIILFWGAIYTIVPISLGSPKHYFHHLYDGLNLEKQVHTLCA